MQALARRAEESREAPAIQPPPSPRANWTRWRLAASNIGVAAIFYAALAAHLRNYHSAAELLQRLHSTAGIADLVWLCGSALMGGVSLIRVAPVAALVSLRSVLATTLMMAMPALIVPRGGSSGPVAAAGLAIECFGVIMSEGSRVYLGRRFGLLPANRGIVSGGPFRLVRHPIYSGWLILTLGLVIAYPSPRNLMMLAATLPIMIVRINLEEQLLTQDPAYRAYCSTTRYRLIPLVY